MVSFNNYKKGSEKGYMEREGFFYYEIHMKCARVIHFTLLPRPLETVRAELGINSYEHVFLLENTIN